MNTTTQHPLSRLDPDDITSAWTARGLDRITDAELLHAACQQLSVPRNEASELVHPSRPAGTDGTSPTASHGLDATARVRSTTHRPYRRHLVDDRCIHETVANTVHDEHPLDALTTPCATVIPQTADRAFVSLCARRDQDQIVDDLVDIVLPQLGGCRPRRHPPGVCFPASGRPE